MTQSQHTELVAGLWLVVGTLLTGSLLLFFRGPFVHWLSSSPDVLRRFDAITAGVMGYGFYVAADCLSAAEWPEFLRDHLFDGLVPAALIGLPILFLPRDNPHTAFPRIRKPWMILASFYVCGALIFGLVAAAAVFSSGSKYFGDTIGFCAALGGIVFPLAYFRAVLDYIPESKFWKWWFTKRPDEVYDAGEDKRWETVMERHERLEEMQRAQAEARERETRNRP
jgi:hypothetical protein